MEKLKNIFLEHKKAFLYGGIGLLSLIILITIAGGTFLIKKFVI